MSDPTTHARAMFMSFMPQNAWGHDISEERQHELDAILATWGAEANHSDRKGPFDCIDLSEKII